MIGGDPADLRAHARAIRGWVSEVESGNGRVRGAAGVHWESTAGAAFQERLGQAAGQGDTLVDRMNTAAEKLDHLANTLESRQHTLIDLLHQAGKTLADAEHMIANGVTDVMGEAHSLANQALDLGKGALEKGKHVLDDVTGGLL